MKRKKKMTPDRLPEKNIYLPKIKLLLTPEVFSGE
jgi:hypothetical protein